MRPDGWRGQAGDKGHIAVHRGSTPASGAQRRSMVVETHRIFQLHCGTRDLLVVACGI